jgi:hypothetical protein
MGMEDIRDELIMFARLSRNKHMEKARSQRLFTVATPAGQLRDLTAKSFERHVRLAREWNRAKLRLVLGKPIP